MCSCAPPVSAALCIHEHNVQIIFKLAAWVEGVKGMTCYNPATDVTAPLEVVVGMGGGSLAIAQDDSGFKGGSAASFAAGGVQVVSQVILSVKVVQ